MPPKASSLHRWVAILVVVIFVATLAMVIYGLIGIANMPMNMIARQSEEIAARSGYSIFFVKGAVIIFTIPLFIAWTKIYPTVKEAILGFSGPSFDPLALYRKSKDGKYWGLVIIAYPALYSIVVGLASRNAYAYKFCGDRPDGSVFITDSNGKDPVYGEALHPCRTDERPQDPTVPQARELTDAQIRKRGFFDRRGVAQVWYASVDGAYRFFDQPGHDSDGDELRPVTRDIVAAWYRDQQRKERSSRDAEARATAQQGLIADSAQAQQQYRSGAFEQALASCKPVLASNPEDQDCNEIQHDASLKLASQLTDRAQAQLQHGELIDAERNATRATRLDPTNEAARNVLTLAQQLRSSK